MIYLSLYLVVIYKLFTFAPDSRLILDHKFYET